MRIFQEQVTNELIEVLNEGGVAVLRTDTLYGVVARADDEKAVGHVYKIKGRDGDKSPIILISSIEQLYDQPSAVNREFLDTVWPGKVSVILPSENAPKWIRRENKSVAYRLPADKSLRLLIEKTGPLIAPSANPQGEMPAMSISQAIKYFADKVDVYVDGGTVEDTSPSQLIRIMTDGTTERLR
ncbi:MAG TPA: L-threonylcarbamoyladenylate synthase [Candidatus Saccharimonadales bacterium]